MKRKRMLMEWLFWQLGVSKLRQKHLSSITYDVLASAIRSTGEAKKFISILQKYVGEERARRQRLCELMKGQEVINFTEFKEHRDWC